jgi:hypothetical protein
MMNSTSSAVCAGRLRHCSGGEMLAPSQVYRDGIVPLRTNAGLLTSIAPGEL